MLLEVEVDPELPLDDDEGVDDGVDVVDEDVVVDGDEVDDEDEGELLLVSVPVVEPEDVPDPDDVLVVVGVGFNALASPLPIVKDMLFPPMSLHQHLGARVKRIAKACSEPLAKVFGCQQAKHNKAEGPTNKRPMRRSCFPTFQTSDSLCLLTTDR